ncbi:hypothetical protein ACPOL_2868 [Acidisarcina polymorpha]|uniref:Uncharacterized protein n=1 Tax=Acidisarcina polymorpha TaxID=2211140 RepID=A0A2Z5FZD8_9BACT|nr:hypothetical protein ACPOL_2868 [Acidisarcina polymorpha]
MQIMKWDVFTTGQPTETGESHGMPSDNSLKQIASHWFHAAPPGTDLYGWF